MTTGPQETTIIAVEGMGCDHCRKTIEEDLHQLEGIFEARVDLGKKQAEVKFDPQKVSREQIRKRITELGYEA
ncbi:MAG: heavy-metal-associated domain-containing protein [Candidatus Tectomicrobia bacterium]|uniref:Heavy-metal-associated domain-containing protein n=1 Tax=Tectimicrobiota bacterium TaxID=2528274 RepID=A0A932CNR6_UNCTE|nr:heavy-metal-associated domain-containing protein [Candidatus Tectomicrobia bacterium]